MRVRSSLFLLLVLAGHLPGRSQPADPPRGAAAPSFTLPALEEPAARFTDAQLGFVRAWVVRLAPAAPPAAAGSAAEAFLAELARRDPSALDHLLAADFPAAAHESALLRQLALALAGPEGAGLREQLAVLRIARMPGGEGSDPAGAAGLLASLKARSAFQHRRLVEGRMDDEELRLALRRLNEPATAPVAAAPEVPRELTAGEIVAEFARRNQEGNAVQRLLAYVVEARLRGTDDSGEELVLFRMRPDRFRLVVRQGGRTRYVLAAVSDRYWQQLPGRPPQFATGAEVGERRHLAEFLSPLLLGEGFDFARLPDGEEGAVKFHRLAVRRRDGTSFVARVDHESWREIGREFADGSIARYSDFRAIGGVTIAFHEEVTDPRGRRSVLEISRATANPGLISEIFLPPLDGTWDLFRLESVGARPGPPADDRS